MKKSLYQVVSAAVFAVLLASCSGAPSQDASQNAAPAESPTATAPTARGSAAAIQVAFSVEAIDAEKRLITLKGPQGNVGVYEVGDQVQRLAEIKVGDKINAKYEVAAVAELREPTEEEKSAPLVEVTSDPQRAMEGPPAGSISRAVRAVTTIESLDSAAQTVTVKDPVEGSVTAHVEDPAVFGQLKVGQTIVVTFAETLALAVEPGK